MDNPQAFRGVAKYYSKFRLGYPKDFFDYIINKFKPNESSRLLDIGCGTGQIAIPLAPYFTEVIGLDPSEDMLVEAKKQAEQKQIHNIIWKQEIAEEISPELGTFKLAIIGYAFHWMEAKIVLDKLYEIIEPNGGVVIVWDDLSPNNSPKITQLREKEIGVANKYLDPHRTKKEIVTPEENFERVLKASLFNNVENYSYDYDKTWKVEEIIGLMYSRPANLQIVDKTGFEKELTEELLKIEPSGKFIENLRVKALLGYKY